MVDQFQHVNVTQLILNLSQPIIAGWLFEVSRRLAHPGLVIEDRVFGLSRRSVARERPHVERLARQLQHATTWCAS